MSILTIIILLVVVGFLLWVINKLVPMQPTIKTILNVVVIIILIVFLLKAVGAWDYLNRVTVLKIPTIEMAGNNENLKPTQ